MLGFIAFLVFTSFPIFEFPLPLANAETLLTTGQELTNAQFSQSVHNFFCKRIRIQGFDRDAQCFAEPGANTIGSYSLVLQLGGDAMLGHYGLIICYVGQLDPTFTAHGLAPSMPYQISNRPNNELAKICKEGKEKLKQGNGCHDPECYEFVTREWHAIQFKEHPNGRDLQMTMSTSNYSFLIPRDQLENGLLVFKFTIANEYKARFSKTIGPGQQVGRRPTIGEKKSKVKVDLDEKLGRNYYKNVHAGARLEQFNAPYAVSVDFLPSMEGIREFSVFLIRSECSQVPATFLTPMDSNAIAPEPIRMQIADKNKTDVLAVKLGSTTFFRGRVPLNAKNFTFQYQFRYKDEDKNDNVKLTLRMIVQFEEGKQTSNAIEIGASKNDDPTFQTLLYETKEIKFTKGANFLFKVLSKENHLALSLNCGPCFSIKRGQPLTKILRIKINTYGDVDVFSVSNNQMQEGDRCHAINYVKLDKPRMGYFIRAKPLENWIEIKIELLRRKDHDEEHVLDFTANNKGITINHGNETHLLEKYIDEQKVELQFNLYEKYITVILDGESLLNTTMENNTVEIIQINADFNLTKNATIYHTPAYFPIATLFKGGKGVHFEGKVLPIADTFSIRFYSYKGAFDMLKCHEETFIQCDIILDINVDFKKTQTVIGNFLPANSDQNKKVLDKKTFEHNRFGRGQDFEITIKYEGGKFLLIYEHANGLIDEFETKEFADGNQIAVDGAIFLLDVPKII